MWTREAMTYQELMAYRQQSVGAGLVSLPMVTHAVPWDEGPWCLRLYVPDWTPEARIAAIADDLDTSLAAEAPRAVILISGCPRESLRGDWYEQYPGMTDEVAHG